MGIRINGKSTGKSPGLNYNTYVDECLEFLKIQIILQEPKAIVCLGNVLFFNLLPKVSSDFKERLMELIPFLKLMKKVLP